MFNQSLEIQEYVQKLRDGMKPFQESSEQTMRSHITIDLYDVAEFSGTSASKKQSGDVMRTVP